MHWVYIYEEEKDDLKIGLSVAIHNLISNLLPTVRIVYLRPFNLPFDAIAHKHLLDDLSKESVLRWIDKHKDETKRWLNLSLKN